MKRLMLTLLLAPVVLLAQNSLSPAAELHVVTCGPYQGELYSAFGHSALRLHDPDREVDVIFNYGVFNFNQPNFYLNFARGYSEYRLAVSDYQSFRDFYIADDRYFHEQVLNLNHEQKEALAAFLWWNAQPENRNYFYDYFYDNCATRITDALERVLGDSLRLDTGFVEQPRSFRELCDLYLEHQPWGDLGIDICLGLPMDKIASPREHHFLPDYVEKGLADSEVYHSGQWQPLVKEYLVTHKSQNETESRWQWPPWFVFWSFGLLGVLASWWGLRKNHRGRGADALLFGLMGLVGWLLSALWFFTNHGAAAQNFNLLWAVPLHFPLCFWLLRKKRPAWLRLYFGFIALLMLVVLTTWNWWPQDLHDAMWPLVLLLGLRAFLIWREPKL